ncbi:transposase [Haloquadratum walsbyi]|uniref:transposase n=1 Tax=Haloquadratum walsbyi TaxID=293091 RepID=UPI003CCB95FC
MAVVTEHGETAVYHARPEFERFLSYSERIATLQSELPDDKYTSCRIQYLYEERSRIRDHSRNAAVNTPQSGCSNGTLTPCTLVS